MLFFQTGCQKTIPAIEPQCTDLVDVKLVLQPFLTFCGGIFENDKTLIVEVATAGVEKKADGTIANPMFSADQSFEISNKDPIHYIDIKVPACGSFITDVIIRGKDGSCYKCCGTMSAGAGIPCQNDPRTGTPKFRAALISINSSLEAPPPSTIDVNPVLTGCKCCK